MQWKHVLTSFLASSMVIDRPLSCPLLSPQKLEQLSTSSGLSVSGLKPLGRLSPVQQESLLLAYNIEQDNISGTLERRAYKDVVYSVTSRCESLILLASKIVSIPTLATILTTWAGFDIEAYEEEEYVTFLVLLFVVQQIKGFGREYRLDAWIQENSKEILRVREEIAEVGREVEDMGN